MAVVFALFQPSVAFEPVLERGQLPASVHFFAAVDVDALLLVPKSFDSRLL